jgi:hypothetical protein
MKKHTFVILAILALALVACDAVLSQKYSEVEEQSLTVGDAPVLTIENFAGDVTIRAGERGTLQVVATKCAGRQKDLGRIKVEIIAQDGGVEIKTDRPSGLRNDSVDLEITAPADTHVTLTLGAGDVKVRGLGGDVQVDNGAGDVEIDGASGEIDTHTGAGNIDVYHAAGIVRLHTGAGDIDYQGQPQRSCRFDTGAGSIKLRLPTDVSVTVDLDTSIGDIDVGMPLDGQVSKREVKGTIGSGDAGEIRAHTGAGDIDLMSQ